MSKRALHISPEILEQSDLSLLACAVLAEVLDLYQVNGQVFASDEHFAERCHSKPRTVRETIAELVAKGHLTREVNYAARHKRLLTPGEQWRISPEVVADSAGSSGEICRDLWRISPEVVADSANINTILNNNPNTLSEGGGELAPLSASSANEQPDAQPASEPPAGSAPADVPATPPRAGRASRKRGAVLPTDPAELLPASCLLAKLLNPGGLAAKVQQLAEPLTLAQAERLLAEYNLPALHAIFCEMANYRKLLTASTSANLTARNWLSKRPKADTAPFPASPTTILTPVAAEEELDEPARLFRAEQAAREQAEQDAHFARWAARPATATA